MEQLIILKGKNVIITLLVSFDICRQRSFCSKLPNHNTKSKLLRITNPYCLHNFNPAKIWQLIVVGLKTGLKNWSIYSRSISLNTTCTKYVKLLTFLTPALPITKALVYTVPLRGDSYHTKKSMNIRPSQLKGSKPNKAILSSFSCLASKEPHTCEMGRKEKWLQRKMAIHALLTREDPLTV